MTTRNEDRKFIEEVIESTLLETAVDWIARNLTPDAVFTETKLTTWATDNGFVKEDAL